MLSSFERLVTFRYLRSRRKESFFSLVAWFSLLGITLGVATLIIVMAVMNGFRQELISTILGLNGHLEISAERGGVGDHETLAKHLRNIEGVVSAEPVVVGKTLLAAGNQSSGALVRGLTTRLIDAKPRLRDNIAEGGLGNFDAQSGVLIGRRLARQLGVSAGDRLGFLLPEGNTTPFGILPRLKTFRIAGVFDVGMQQYDSGFVYMPLAAAQTFFKLGDRVSHIEVTATHENAVPALRERIAEDLGPSFGIRSWLDINDTFLTALEVERNVMFLILTLIILVAAFNVVSSQVMLVHDKEQGIAILRTMGASRGSILRIFFAIGASVGSIGTLVGGLLGIAIADNVERIRQWLESLSGVELFQAEIYFLSKLPAKIDPVEISVVVVMALVISFVASMYPAWRAARLNPVELLRYE